MSRRVENELDALVRKLTEVTRFLPAVTAENAVAERRRMIAVLERGELPVPAWRVRARRREPLAMRWLDAARRLAGSVSAGELYLARLEELELELAMIHALADSRRIRPLAARRFGTGSMAVPVAQGHAILSDVAASILSMIADTVEPRALPAESREPGDPSLGSLVRAMARAAGIEVEVRIEPRLAAGAAAGDRVVFLAARRFGRREAVRLSVHEVLGHLVAAANGRAQPQRILELGTAGAFEDQEGLAIWLEEQAGVLDGHRLRVLAARVVAADRMHEGASFGETARHLVREYGFGAEDAVHLAERAYRGGGVARDVGYLSGWLRVRGALASGSATLDELRAGRVGLSAIPTLRRLAAEGLVRPPPYRPSLVRSLRATEVGTSFEMSPPSDAASFTRFELT